MTNESTPQSLLAQIAQIARMEPGKLCVMRQGSQGPFYNLQCRENGKNVSRYVPRDQVQTVAAHTANYQQFQALVEQYVTLVATRTRHERETDFKKKTPPPTSSSPKIKKSNS